jgi:hypothetical protein
MIFDKASTTSLASFAIDKISVAHAPVDKPMPL